MRSRIIFLVGAPDFAPGILYKIFVEQKSVTSFFRPFTPNLDLIVEHLRICRSDLSLFPGYFDEYARSPRIFSSSEIVEGCLAASSTSHVVFDLGEAAAELAALKQRYPEALVVGLGPQMREAPQEFFSSLEQLHGNYIGAGEKILGFCGIKPDHPLSLNSDWVHIDYRLRGLTLGQREKSLALSLPRDQLKIYLKQKASLSELGRLEYELSSTKMQLEAAHKLIHEKPVAPRKSFLRSVLERRK